MANDHDVAFPTLGARDLTALSARGHPRAVQAGEVLFAEGDRDFCFFVVLEGSIEIVEHSRGTPHTVAEHGPGEFTGDVDMLTGRAALVTARAAQAGRVLALSTAELRRAVDELPELGEIIVKAFLMRRTLLARSGLRGRQDHRLPLLPGRPSSARLRHAERSPVYVDRSRYRRAGGRVAAALRHPASDTPIVIGPGGTQVTESLACRLRPLRRPHR